MTDIAVDFETFKALTSLRLNENDTLPMVVRRLVGLPAVSASEPSGHIPGGVVFENIYFPNGTEFRAKPGGVLRHCQVVDGKLVDENGVHQTSLSRAASNANGGANRNGWWFWECKRPGDETWEAPGRYRENQPLHHLSLSPPQRAPALAA